MPFAVIRNELGVVADVAAKFLEIPAQLAYFRWWVADQIEAVTEILNQLKRPSYVAMPQIAPHAFEHRDGRRHRGVERWWQATGHLLEHRDAHGDVEIVENVLRIGTHVILEIAQIAGAIRHEGHLLVHRNALIDEKRVKAALRFFVMPRYKAKSPHRPFFGHGLGDDHLEFVGLSVQLRT
ncbi:MAG: hypothetical protein EOS60_34110 [Mesorhizobium sp.]|nr:MAG: hypothetical protein EOS60_34110 [Mesorhizobium sp.]